MQASMARLTEEMVIARSKQSDLSAVTKLNCWGAELTDVTLLRRMPNVEVLAFSINKIRHLEDFAWCGRLRELYVRKNDIRSLSEIRHLRRLPALHALWLDENPCTNHPQYRMTVLRNLPNLEKLDNVPVQPEEVAEALRRGEYIPDSDDEGYPQQAESPPRAASPVSPPRPADLVSESPEPEVQSQEPVVTRLQSSPPRPRPASAAPRGPSDMTSSYTEARVIEEAPLRHSVSTHSVKDYSISCLGDGRPSTSPLHEGRDRQDPRCPLDYESPQSQYNASEQSHSHARTQPREQTREWRDSSRDLRESPRDLRESSRDLREEREFEKDRDYDREYPREVYNREFREREREREYPSAVMGARRGFSRRPVTRNSNLLSALLCLVKELDYPSLEVAEMAVRCRMDELANGQ